MFPNSKRIMHGVRGEIRGHHSPLSRDPNKSRIFCEDIRTWHSPHRCSSSAFQHPFRIPHTGTGTCRQFHTHGTWSPRSLARDSAHRLNLFGHWTRIMQKFKTCPLGSPQYNQSMAMGYLCDLGLASHPDIFSLRGQPSA